MGETDTISDSFSEPCSEVDVEGPLTATTNASAMTIDTAVVTFTVAQSSALSRDGA